MAESKCTGFAELTAAENVFLACASAARQRRCCRCPLNRWVRRLGVAVDDVHVDEGGTSPPRAPGSANRVAMALAAVARSLAVVLLGTAVTVPPPIQTEYLGRGQ